MYGFEVLLFVMVAARSVKTSNRERERERERRSQTFQKPPKKLFVLFCFVFLSFFFIKISVASQVGRLITLQLLLALPGFVYSTVDDFLKHICL